MCTKTLYNIEIVKSLLHYKAMNYNRSTLLSFLIEHFDDNELRIFCSAEFRAVYNDFADGWGKSRKALELVEWCERHSQQTKLLSALYRERPKSYQVIFGKILPQSTNEINVQAEIVDSKSTDIPDKKKLSDKSNVLSSHSQNYRVHQITGKEMILIPTGVFLYGEKNERLHLSKFWQSKTPVTNIEYARFVADTDYATPKHWYGSKIPSQDIADHPVVYVSWGDAKAYVEWAGCRLPTEQEWEKAARGINGRIYPWGNDWKPNHCNSDEASIGTTSPVGHFSPRGDSPFGCVDMSGNVWEWTASLRQRGRNSRVLRGGAFTLSSYLQDTRTTYRGINDPSIKDYNLGFRIVEDFSPSRNFSHDI